MVDVANFTLSYTGRRADHQEIDFYDVSEALVGFQRYLALTTHLLVNGEIITQAPALKNARIYALPPEEGSWKITAAIMIAAGTAMYNIGTADKDTPIGHFARSVYAYVIQESVGVDPDYDKTIGQQIKEEKKKNPNFPDLPQSKLDALIEKCHSGIARMHRPIVASKTAKEASIRYDDGNGNVIETGSLGRDTYEYMSFDLKENGETLVIGRVTSYNIHTYKGRIYLPEEKRPVPFILVDYARTPDNIGQITSSLSVSAQDIKNDARDLKCFVVKVRSRTSRLKSMFITRVLSPK